MKRIEKIIGKLNEQKLDGALITHLPNVRYLSGYSGSNGMLFIHKDGAHFLTDFRYKSQIERELFDGIKSTIIEKSMLTDLAKIDALKKARKIGFEKKYLKWETYDTLNKLLPAVQFVPTENLVEETAMTKEPSEIEMIEKAIDISQKALQEVLPMIKVGTPEIEIAAEIDYRARRLGADKPAFDTIVVAGKNGALVHGQPGTYELQKGDFITIDWGSFYGGYTSDITRTFILGEPDEKQRKIYNIVMEAQKAGIEAAKPGLPCRELDAIARKIIDDAGYGEYFGHALGHGIGVEVHYLPYISPKAPENMVLQTGMTITVEPGIYIPDWGGIRIEDDVLITETGARVLSTLPKEVNDVII